MTLDLFRSLLGWCTVLNFGLLIWWFVTFWVGHDWVYGLHSRIFRLSIDSFDAVHYAGMAGFKVGIFLFNLVPYLALLIVTR